MTYDALIESINTFKAMTADGSITPTVLGNLLAQISQYAKQSAEPSTAVITEALETALSAISSAVTTGTGDVNSAKTTALGAISDAKDAAIAAIGGTVITYEIID